MAHDALQKGLTLLVSEQDAKKALVAFAEAAHRTPASLAPLIALNSILARYMLKQHDGPACWGLAIQARELFTEHPWYVPAANLAALIFSSDTVVGFRVQGLSEAQHCLQAALDTALHPQSLLLASAIALKLNDCAAATRAYSRAVVLCSEHKCKATDFLVRAFADTGDGALHVMHRGAATLLDTLYAEGIPEQPLMMLHTACFAHVCREPRLSSNQLPGPLRVTFVTEHLAPGSVLSNSWPVLQHARFASSLVVAVGPVRDNEHARLLRSQGRLREAGEPESAQAQVQALEGADVVVCLDGCTGTLAALNLSGKHTPSTALLIAAIGYAHATCHPRVDCRLGDCITDPVEQVQQGGEPVIRLEPCFLTWAPPAVPLVLRAPALRQGFVANHNFKKLSVTTLRMFARVLADNPGFSLTLKPTSPVTPGQRQWVRNSQQLGPLFACGRVVIEDAIKDTSAYLAFLTQFVLCLDATPYCGTVTTLEALWCDLPVVTLTGQQHRARVGTSILHCLGRHEWCADTEDEYVEIANKLVRDRPPAGTVHDALVNSSILDHTAYGNKLHSLLQQAHASA